jgi:antitoxin component YwqK of YwqJK toxin-antitoxin module
MVRLARYPAKFFMVLLLTVSCNRAEKDQGERYLLNASDSTLQKEGGRLLRNGAFYTGTVVELFEGKDTVARTEYLDGHAQGWSYKWYPDGKLSEQRWFVQGKKEGWHTGWYPNGKKKFQYAFRNDEHEGEAIEWYPSGAMARRFHYNKGQEDGLQQAWWEDGSVRANYAVRNGRQYGLIGRKFCSNKTETNAL